SDLLLRLAHGRHHQRPAEPQLGRGQPGVGENHIGARHQPARVLHDRDHTSSRKTRWVSPARLARIVPGIAYHSSRCASLDRLMRSRWLTMADGVQTSRSRGSMCGLALILLGAWGGVAPFAGPSVGFGFTPDRAWESTSGRLFLSAIPGAVVL